jgi:hypothetical protein|tara:strand:- start:5066 stop:6016 length:951 start_codon:yes stop_codon:yes gene_type:complete
MNYSEEYVFIVYIVVIICLIGLITLVYFFNIGDFLHSYKGKGTIAAYYGIKPPKGWVLCDGKNGTPDLRGRFVYGGNVLSQQLYNNVFKSEGKQFQKYFVNNTEQITGGKNYQTLTNRVENLDDFIESNLLSSNNAQIIETIEDNKNMNHSLIYRQTTLDIINENIVTNVITHTLDENKSNRIGKAIDIPDNINTMDEMNTFVDKTDETTIKEAEVNSIKTRIDNVSKQLTKLKIELGNDEYDPVNIKDKLDEAKTKPNEYAQILKTQEDIVNDAESNVVTVEGPDYEGYKYPSNKNLNADLNLPPYYALIYIMKI